MRNGGTILHNHLSGIVEERGDRQRRISKHCVEPEDFPLVPQIFISIFIKAWLPPKFCIPQHHFFSLLFINLTNVCLLFTVNFMLCIK